MDEEHAEGPGIYRYGRYVGRPPFPLKFEPGDTIVGAFIDADGAGRWQTEEEWTRLRPSEPLDPEEVFSELYSCAGYYDASFDTPQHEPAARERLLKAIDAAKIVWKIMDLRRGKSGE